MAKKERDFNAPYRKEAAQPHININPTQDRYVVPSVMTVQRGVLDAGSQDASYALCGDRMCIQ